ncbi:MAG: hypothetical protein CO128_01320 [Ignavibacteriales bacterium CG_4_9_14_3_um_filter_30_11]|nr:MAG: hypothetical protein CO128_01320 [Ignavibacteriales bacterium CG_4_9_14_3_um_filter_30_11]
MFISFNSGLKHNAVYENLAILHESILQLIDEENLKLEMEKIPSVSELEKHFQNEEDFYKQFSNGTWLHLQELSKRNYIAESKKEFVL